MKRIFSILFLFLFLCGCQDVLNYRTVKYSDVIDSVKSSGKSAWVIVGDYNIVQNAQKIGMSELISEFKNSFDFYFCDLSIAENEHINYIYRLETIPAALLLSPKSDVVYISSSEFGGTMLDDIREKSLLYNRNSHIDYSNRSFSILNDSLLYLYSTTYRLYSLLDGNVDSVDVQQIRYLLSNSLDLYHYFYNYYLGFKLYESIGDSISADYYKKSAIDCFEKNKTQLYRYLYYELLQKEIKESPYLEIDSTDIDLGEVPVGDTVRTSVLFKNIGKSPLVILNDSTSCRCVNADWQADAIPSNSYGKIDIVYNAEEPKGKFHKTLVFITNAANSSVIITVHGKVI